jgi:glutamyl-tRNA reductase
MTATAKNELREGNMTSGVIAGNGFEPDVNVRTREYRIGCVGAGMIMAECHLAAYKEAGFPVVAIASRTKASAEKVAGRWEIPSTTRRNN